MAFLHGVMQIENLILNVRREQIQIHDLRNASAGDVADTF